MKYTCSCSEKENESNKQRVQTQEDKVVKPLPILSSFENLHDEVLRENLPLMVDDMEIQRTDLLNELIEDDVISSDEGSTIRKAGNRQAQTRNLLSIISKRSSKKFEIFLKRLGERNNYPPIANTLKKHYNRKKNEYFQLRSKSGRCLACTIIHKVNLDDVIDMLIKYGVVDWNFLNQRRKSHNGISDWMHVFERIESVSPSQRIMFINCMCLALQKKHTEIAEMLTRGYEHHFHCYCKPLTAAKCIDSNQTSMDCFSYVSSSGYALTSSEDRESITSCNTTNKNSVTSCDSTDTESINSSTPTTTEFNICGDAKTSKSSIDNESLKMLDPCKHNSDKVKEWLLKTKSKTDTQKQEKRKTKIIDYGLPISLKQKINREKRIKKSLRSYFSEVFNRSKTAGGSFYYLDI